ncbi:LysE family translocator [Teredinibacter turnerae]|uniref:LysE family translocator n=1 Tax=Teredinibacter turnerae TaxID=2426 RepID=UPI000377F1E7|nr:LysE family translocator [Teredinibacter turnerae]
MSIESYFVFFFVSLLTISSPGPGVVFSLTNAMKGGFSYAAPGFVGLALGTLVISAIAVSGIGTLLATHDYAFTLLKYAGALYLVYLGIKLWRSSSVKSHNDSILEKPASTYERFRQGVFITLLNPKLIVFFIALFPQFINPLDNFITQFSILSLTFCGLLIVVHIVYCLFAEKATMWLTSSRGHQALNRTSGAIFFCFALGLVLSK